MATEDIGTLLVKIDANTKGLQQGITKAGSLFGSLAKGIAGIGAVVASGAFLKSAIDEAAEAQDGLAQLNAVLKSTGGAAGVTAEQITSLASELQKTTKFSDDQVIAGDNLLLTFTKIGRDVFPAATETMLDMSQALGQDVKGSAIQLGKALNDPIQGLTALRRVGVSFTDAQKDQIKALQESGDLMGAQKLILKELQTEFGGAAKAAGDTFSGKVARLNNQFGEIKETIGGALLPVLSKMAEWFISKIPAVQTFLTNTFTSIENAFQETKERANVLIPVLAALLSAFLAFKAVTFFSELPEILAPLPALFSNLTFAVEAFAGGAATLGEAIALALGPVGMITIAAGVLVGVIVLLSRQTDAATASIDKYIASVHSESKLHENSVKVINDKVTTLKSLGSEYVSLKNSLDAGKLSDAEAMKAKIELRNVENELIPVIGQEGVARINAAKDAQTGVNAEITAMQGLSDAEKQLLENIYKMEDGKTRDQIRLTSERIADIERESRAYTLAGKIKLWFLQLGGINRNKAIAIDELVSGERQKELDKVNEQLEKLLGKLHSTGEEIPKIPKLDIGDIGSIDDKAKEAYVQLTELEKETVRLNTAMSVLQSEAQASADSMAIQGSRAGELSDKVTWLNKQLDLQYQVTANVKAQIEQVSNAKGKDAEETDNLFKKSQELTAQLAQETAKEADLKKQLFDTNQEIREQAESVAKTRQSLEELADTYKTDLADALIDYQEAVKKATDQEAEDIQSVTKAYEDALEDRADALMDFSEIFEAVNSEMVDPATLLTNLQNQVDQFEQWQSDLDALSSRGLSSGMIDQLRDLGVGSADEIHALTQMSDEQLVKYVALWQEKYAAARNAATDQLTEMQIETQTKIAEIRANTQTQLEQLRIDWQTETAKITADTKKKLQDITDSAKSQGTAFMNNLIQAIRDKRADLAIELDAIKQMMADAIDPTVRHSPSLVDRVKVGMTDILGSYKNALSKLGTMPSLTPAMAGSTTSNNYGNNRITFNITNNDPQKVVDYIERKMWKHGIKW